MAIITSIAVIIAQIIYLPIAALSSTSAARTAPAVTVQSNTSTGYDIVFGYIIYGEVRNNTASPVSLVRVTATQPNGQSADAIAKIGTINANELGCFAIYTQSADPWNDAALSASYMPAYEQRTQFTVDETEQGIDNGYPTVNATIVNSSNVTMTLVTAVSTLYDTAGNVIGCGDAHVQPRLLGIDKAGTVHIRFSQWTKRDVGSYVVAFRGEKIKIPQ